jgi:hypothetical protein
MALRFRDRFFTPQVARAITSPAGILLAGGGVAVGVVAGLPVALAVALGAAAWAGRVAVAIPRGSRERIDPFAIQEPWRQFVQGALAAQARFTRTVQATRSGPLRERLTEIGHGIDRGVRESWRIASRGHDIDAALKTIDTNEVRRDLDALPQTGERVETTRQSLLAQLASADRLARVSADARDRLRLLDARLDELVARAAELSVGSDDHLLGVLDADVEGLVNEMEALRQAIEETNRPGPASGELPSPGS